MCLCTCVPVLVHSVGRSFSRSFVPLSFVRSSVHVLVCPLLILSSNSSQLKLVTTKKGSVQPNSGRFGDIRHVQSYLVTYFELFLFFTLPFRKKTKVAPNVIQISSKSRLSSWSNPDIKVRSQSVIARNSSVSSFTSLGLSKLGDLPRSFSDSCLAKRRLDDDVDVFKNPSSSAPQSCSGSSGSDDEDEGSGETEDMENYDPSVTQISWIVSVYKFSLLILIL